MSPIASSLLMMPTSPKRQSFNAAITLLPSISPFPLASHLTIEGPPAVTMLSDTTTIAVLPEPWPSSYVATARRYLPTSSGSTGVWVMDLAVAMSVKVPSMPSHPGIGPGPLPRFAGGAGVSVGQAGG